MHLTAQNKTARRHGAFLNTLLGLDPPPFRAKKVCIKTKPKSSNIGSQKVLVSRRENGAMKKKCACVQGG